MGRDFFNLLFFFVLFFRRVGFRYSISDWVFFGWKLGLEDIELLFIM